jgi:hypothetical protein
MLLLTAADKVCMTLSVPESEPLHGPPLPSLDRRSEDRLAVCVPVRVTYVNGSRTSVQGTCTNVSTAGAAFDLEAILQAGDVIDFEFRKTNDIPVTYRARILYRERNHYGAYFLMAH